MLVCDDVRVEVGGTLTLVGVHNDRLLATPGEGPIRLTKLMFVAIVGGLEGISQVGFRQRIRETSEVDLGAAAMVQEPHNPQTDEHNFIFGDAPMVFPGPGTYEVVLDIEAAGKRESYAMRFKVLRTAT